jgi:hypothetical protein
MRTLSQRKNERRPLEQGVFRRPNPLNGGPQIPVMLYINTNKTAEIAKSGRNKGYALPWICNAHVNGAKIRLLPTFDGRKSDGKTTLFPLHSLRVSLVTALSLEGQVPFPILQKLVGHPRTMMTIYRAAV